MATGRDTAYDNLVAEATDLGDVLVDPDEGVFNVVPGSWVTIFGGVTVVNIEDDNGFALLYS